MKMVKGNVTIEVFGDDIMRHKGMGFKPVEEKPKQKKPKKDK